MQSKVMYGLKRRYFPKNKRWLLDCDYLDQLSEDERAWLDKFQREYYDGAIKKGDSEALHHDDELRKDCYRRNNARNRDLYAIKQSVGCLHEITPLQGIDSHENKTNRAIDQALDEHHSDEVFFLGHYMDDDETPEERLRRRPKLRAFKPKIQMKLAFMAWYDAVEVATLHHMLCVSRETI